MCVCILVLLAFSCTVENSIFGTFDHGATNAYTIMVFSSITVSTVWSATIFYCQNFRPCYDYFLWLEFFTVVRILPLRLCLLMVIF